MKLLLVWEDVSVKTHTFLTLAVRHFYNFKQDFLLNLLCLNSILLNFTPGSTSYLISKFCFFVLWRHSSPYLCYLIRPFLLVWSIRVGLLSNSFQFPRKHQKKKSTAVKGCHQSISSHKTEAEMHGSDSCIASHAYFRTYPALSHCQENQCPHGTALNTAFCQAGCFQSNHSEDRIIFNKQ